MAEVLGQALNLPPGQWQSVEKVAAKALRSLGWDNKPVKEKGETVRVWQPKAAAEPLSGDAL